MGSLASNTTSFAGSAKRDPTLKFGHFPNVCAAWRGKTHARLAARANLTHHFD
jgi:hypothetical protein